MNKLVIASNNQGKLREIQALLTPLNIEVLSQASLNISEADEPHFTFIENALAKARHASLHSGLAALADDSGLCVQGLQGRPGVYSARFADMINPDGCVETNADKINRDEKNNLALLSALADQSNRSAYYYCALVLVRRHDDPQPIIAEGIWSGEILPAPRGSNGFGYDPLFLDLNHHQTGAELNPDIKNKISHRGQALQQLLIKIKALKV
jgi:XTP/dITP diphosphohydrolase